MSHPVVRGRGEAAERAVLVSRAGLAPQTHRAAAAVPAEETHRYTGGAQRRAAQILQQVKPQAAEKIPRYSVTN